MPWNLKANIKGPSLEMQKSGSYIQWRIAGSSGDWTNLLPLSDIQGLPGALAATNDAQVAGFVSTAGASDTQTALDKRYGKFLDVKKYGAVGDGVAIDGPAIQALMDTAGSTPIVFPPGTYKITNQLVVASDDQTLIGTGGTLAPIATVHGIYASGKKRLRVDGLKFTGGLNQIYLDAGSDDARIVECISTAPLSAFVRVQLSHRARVVRNTATAIPFGGSGVIFWGGNAATAPGVYGIDGGLVEGNHFTGFVPTSSADLVSSPCWASCAQNLRIVGNYFSSFADVGIDFEGSKDCVAVGNVVKDCANGGLATFYGTTGCLFEGNRVVGTAALTDGSRARTGIRVGTSGASSNNSFVGNHISMTSGFGQFGAHIDGSTFAVGATHKGLVFRGNTFTDCQVLLLGVEDCFVQGNTVNNGQIRSQGSDRTQITGNTVYAGALSSPAAFRLHNFSATKIGKNLVVKDNTIRDYAASGFGKILIDQTGGTATVGHVLMNNLTAAATTLTTVDATTQQVGNVVVA